MGARRQLRGEGAPVATSEDQSRRSVAAGTVGAHVRRGAVAVARSGQRASGEGERAKRRRIGKQKNLEGESEARLYIWWAGSGAETARHR